MSEHFNYCFFLQKEEEQNKENEVRQSMSDGLKRSYSKYKSPYPGKSAVVRTSPSCSHVSPTRLCGDEVKRGDGVEGGGGETIGDYK